MPLPKGRARLNYKGGGSCPCFSLKEKKAQAVRAELEGMVRGLVERGFSMDLDAVLGWESG